MSRQFSSYSALVANLLPKKKPLPNARFIHRSSLEELEPLLRVYEGCARTYLGEIEDANLIKLHCISGKISYLRYPDFDTNPHPALSTCVKLNMRSLQLDFYDYRTSENPPVLHRKETFLPPTHPWYAKFARLTQQEERHGLLDETSTIGTRDGWNRRLVARGFRLHGHRLVKMRQTNDSSQLQPEGSSMTNNDNLIEWLSSAEARAIMRLSTCDLTHLRESGNVRFRKKGNAYLYSVDDCKKVALENGGTPLSSGTLQIRTKTDD